MMILGGVVTPFIVSATIAVDDGEEVSFTDEFATFAAARQALEDFILDHSTHADDYVIDIKRDDLRAGDVVRTAFKTVTAPSGEWRDMPYNVSVGAWAICWRKPEPTAPDPLDDAARKELRSILVADGIQRV